MALGKNCVYIFEILYIFFIIIFSIHLQPMPLFPSSSSAFINAAATRLRPLVGAGDKLAAKRATFNGVNGNGGGIHRSKALAGALVEQSQLNQLQKMQQLQPARLSTFLAMVRKSHAE
jgi:hypothetical protein